MPLWDGRETPEEYEERQRRNAERAAEREERQRLFDERRRAWEEAETIRSFNRSRMASLINDATNLLYSSDLMSSSAHEKMRHLQSQAKEHRNVGRDYQDLNDQFWAVSQDFYNKRKAEFEARDRRNAENLLSMRSIVIEARLLTMVVTDFHDTNTKLRDLKTKLATFRCRREDSDLIWSEFKQIKTDFDEQWRKHKEDIERERKAKERWTSDSVRGVHHISGADGAYVTSKFATDDLDDPHAEGMISMKDSEGGKYSYRFKKDGTMRRKPTKGGFKPENWRDNDEK